MVFENPLFGQSIVFLLSAFALIVSSRWIIDHGRKIAIFLHISEFAVGFILLAIATSLPELTVAIIGSLNGNGSLVIGNVIGANISDILLVLGVSALIAEVHVQYKQLLDNAEILLFITLIPLILLWRGSLGLFSGLVLLIIFGLYTFVLSRIHGKMELDHAHKGESPFIVFGLFCFGVFVLVFSANSFVSSAVSIARLLNFPETVIGLTAVALGTTMAELVVNVQAMLKKAYQLAIGNILGSCVVNLTLVLGTASVINKIEFDYITTAPATFFLIASTILLWYVLFKYKKITKKWGVFFLELYALFILYEILGPFIFPIIFH